jgi:hypothetical protein
MIGDLPALPMMLEPSDEPQGPILKIPISEEKVALFTKEIERARILREQLIAEWQVTENLARYAPAQKNDPGVNVGVDFRDVERKGAALFYDTPTINIQPGPDGNPQAAVLHQELLNGLLSAQKMNAKATALKAIKDCLVAIQPAFTKIGYLPVTVDMPQMNPMTGQPEMGPVVVHDEVFWSRMSGKAGLLPVDFRDTDYDRSPWIGYDFKKPVSQARRDFNLPLDWSPPTGGTREVTFSENKDPAGSSDPQVTGTELWYRACLFDDTVSHPELLRCLVLVDGWPTPVKHENAPWQTLDQTGRLTPDSIQGYPIHPLALRDFPDSAWVPADCSQTGPLTVEINTYLTQAKAKRDSNRLILMTDVSKIDIEGAGRIADMAIFKGMELAILPVQENALIGDGAMKQVPTLDLGRETYLGLEIFEQKRDQILGITAPQGGVQNDSARTATEIATVQRNADARFEQERQRVINWWLAGVRKLSAFVVRYGDRCAEDILGKQRAQQWMQFRQQGMLGAFTYEILIDSGRYVDIESDRRQFLQILNYSAKSPFINQQTLWAEFAKKFGYDPQQWLAQPQPPKPEPPKMSLTFNGDDLAEPQSSMVVEVLAAQGIQISPQAISNMVLALKAKQQAEQAAALTKANPVLGLMANPPQPEPAPPPPGPPGMPPGNPATPGTADQAERLDKHGLQESGSLPGAGAAPGPGAGPVLA